MTLHKRGWFKQHWSTHSHFYILPFAVCNQRLTAFTFLSLSSFSSDPSAVSRLWTPCAALQICSRPLPQPGGRRAVGGGRWAAGGRRRTAGGERRAAVGGCRDHSDASRAPGSAVGRRSTVPPVWTDLCTGRPRPRPRQSTRHSPPDGSGVNTDVQPARAPVCGALDGSCLTGTRHFGRAGRPAVV